MLDDVHHIDYNAHRIRTISIQNRLKENYYDNGDN